MDLTDPTITNRDMINELMRRNRSLVIVVEKPDGDLEYDWCGKIHTVHWLMSAVLASMLHKHPLAGPKDDDSDDATL